MRKRMIVALILATAAVGPAAAQPTDNARGGVATETQDRMAGSLDKSLIWNLLGLLGLVGLTGVWRASDNDGYTDDPI